MKSGQVLETLRQAAMIDGRLQKPHRYGQAVALLAQVWGLYLLELRKAGDVVTPAEFGDLKSSVERFIGPLANNEQVESTINDAEELWNLRRNQTQDG